MITNYNYADYDSLTDDQKLLWWFDEYLRYDLVLFNRRFIGDVEIAFLIERHDIYHYFSWADNYSYYLWNLLCNKSYESIIQTSVSFDLIIPDTIKNKIIITYLHETGHHISLLQRVGNNIFTRVFSKHHFYGNPKEKINIMGCWPYSVVINGDKQDISIIESLFPPNLLYKNIDSWGDSFDSTSPVSKGRTVETKTNMIGGRVEKTIDASALFLESLYTIGWEYMQNVLDYTYAITEEFEPYDTFVDIQLIYAKPISLFVDSNTNVSIFSNQIKILPENKSFGTLYSSIPIFDLIYVSKNKLLRDSTGSSLTFTVNIKKVDDWGDRYTYEGRGTGVLISNTNGYFIDIEGIEYAKNNELNSRSVSNAVNILNTLILQTEDIKKRKITLSNLREIKDNNGNLVQNINYIEEYVMGLELMVQEIHACLGANEFAYYDDNGTQKPYYMSVSRTLNWFAKAYGVSFNPDGTIMPVRRRVNVAYSSDNKVTLPDGWTRGQFADNQGNSNVGQTGGQTGEERIGIAYQNRCNQYDNFDDADPKNNTLKRGDVVLCENFLQLFESYLEDIDKALNWQEMGTGMLPSADGTSVCTYEGIGTLLAEVAYMLSTLSSNIYQTHTLALKNYGTTIEILKGLGLPIQNGFLPIDLGEADPVSGNVESFLNIPQLADGSVTLHKRLMDVIANLAALNASVLNPVIEEPPSNP